VAGRFRFWPRLDQKPRGKPNVTCGFTTIAGSVSFDNAQVCGCGRESETNWIETRLRIDCVSVAGTFSGGASNALVIAPETSLFAAESDDCSYARIFARIPLAEVTHDAGQPTWMFQLCSAMSKKTARLGEVSGIRLMPNWTSAPD